MRRIRKYRAWFKDTDVENSVGEMIEWDEIKQHSMLWLNRENKDWTYLEFTGIYDKNGKEIYEGDILEFAHNPKWRWGKDLQTVEYSCEDSGAIVGYVLVDKNGTWERGHLTAAKGRKSTVVGNIYERNNNS